MVFNPSEEINTYFNFHQRIVILSLLKVVESRKKKTVYVSEVYNKYIEICEKYSIESVFKSNILQALKIFEVAGFIKIKDGTITKIDLKPYTVDDWIKAIYQDPEFQSLKETN
jgi:Cdc6-like AAA superfamily ATPase